MEFVRDPTSESSETMRLPKALPADIAGKTIALLNISKERSDEFLDRLEINFSEAGFPVKRYRKASHSKTAAAEIIQAIVQEADVVVESLAD